MEGIAFPNVTVTGYGIFRGSFHKNLPRSKLKMEPHTAEIDWNDGNIHAFNDSFHTTPERQHLTDSSHLPLGKDAYDFAIFQSLRCCT